MAGCLIAYGAVLGKVSPVQLLVLTLFGITLYAVEEYIILSILHVRPSRNHHDDDGDVDDDDDDDDDEDEYDDDEDEDEVGDGDDDDDESH